MRRIILLLMLLIAYAGLQAQNAMVLKMKDGTKNVVYLRGPESSPTMVPFVTFEGGDIVIHGDIPVVWTNKNYRMVYLNMGHGDEGFIDATQNLLFTNAFRWICLPRSLQ